MNTFGKRLKNLREGRGITLEELGKSICCHFFMLRDWENGERVLTVGAIIKLSKFFGVTTDYLLGL